MLCMYVRVYMCETQDSTGCIRAGAVVLPPSPQLLGWLRKWDAIYVKDSNPVGVSGKRTDPGWRVVTLSFLFHLRKPSRQRNDSKLTGGMMNLP